MGMGERYFIMVDYQRCTGCKLCETACSLTKTGTVNPAKSRIRVIVKPHIGVDVPILCYHCEDPPCINACPVGAMHRDERGVVVIDEEKCIGCKACIMQCPFGAIFFDPDKRVAIKCDLCGGDPMCVKVCNEAFPEDRVLTYVKPKDAAKWKMLMRVKQIEEGILKTYGAEPLVR